ncbi:MAG: alpha-amylase family glycosyl hydrolase, partial [Rhodothermales bacterium]|nr:alpha-amylase family glycosyl hydrolase [Rhodothermales bacterium]
AMHDVLRFWMARGVDGFRLDALHFIAKDPEERDNPPNPSGKGAFHKPLGEYDTQLHPYDKGHPDIHPWLRDLRRVLDAEGRDVFAIGEMHLYDLDEWRTYFGGNEGGAPLDELHAPYYFALLKADWTAEAVRAAVDAQEAALPEGAWPNYVLGNHDDERIASRVGPAQAGVAAVLLLTLRGTPTLYYGDEIGMPEVAVPPDQQRDPWALRSGLPELSRDGCRTPMAWDASPSAGFSEAAPEALWLPLHPDHERINVATQLADPGSLLNLYRRLLRLRRATPALHGGAYRPFGGAPEGVFAFEREAGGERVLVALNFTGEPRRAALPAWAQSGEVLLSTRREREGEPVGEALPLAENEAVVLG